MVDRYVDEGYIQHNPNVPNGRAALVGFIERRIPTPLKVEDRIKAPLVAIVAERDLVTLSFVREYPDPKDAARKYTTTWFDMFRIANGKIAEHWDSALRQWRSGSSGSRSAPQSHVAPGQSIPAYATRLDQPAEAHAVFSRTCTELGRAHGSWNTADRADALLEGG